MLLTKFLIYLTQLFLFQKIPSKKLWVGFSNSYRIELFNQPKNSEQILIFVNQYRFV